MMLDTPTIETPEDVILNAVIKDGKYVRETLLRYEKSRDSKDHPAFKDNARRAALYALSAPGTDPTTASRALDLAMQAISGYRPNYRWGDSRDAWQAKQNATLDAIYEAIMS